MEQQRLKSVTFWLWISILIYAASNSVVAKIGQLGAMHPINGHNPISFCNLFFAGNVVAGSTLLLIYRKEWKLDTLKQFSLNAWISMFLVIIMSGVLAPAFFFIALMITEVTNVVLISTLDVPLSLIFAYLMFREKPDRLGIFGAFIATIGIFAIFFLEQPPMKNQMTMMTLNVGSPAVNQFLQTFSKAGEILTGLAILVGVIAVQLSRKVLEKVPVGVFSVSRMIMGVILFSIIVLSLFGPHHFDDLFSPFLWRWMIVYGAIIVVLGQITWFKGIKGGASSTDISVATAITPIAGALFAFIILEEVPNRAQYIGGSIIALGIIVSLIGTYRSEKREIKFEKPCSFKGI